MSDNPSENTPLTDLGPWVVVQSEVGDPGNYDAFGLFDSADEAMTQALAWRAVDGDEGWHYEVRRVSPVHTWEPA